MAIRKCNRDAIRTRAPSLSRADLPFQLLDSEFSHTRVQHVILVPCRRSCGCG
jgi:hypothetical protein